MYYDIVFEQYFNENKVSETILGTFEFSQAYLSGKTIAEALYLKEGGGHSCVREGGRYNWMTIMPSDYDTVVLIRPSNIV